VIFVFAKFAFFLSKLFTAWIFRSGQSEVLAHASSSRPVQQEAKKQARIPRDVRAAFLRWRFISAEMHSAYRSLKTDTMGVGVKGRAGDNAFLTKNKLAKGGQRCSDLSPLLPLPRIHTTRGASVRPATSRSTIGTLTGSRNTVRVLRGHAFFCSEPPTGSHLLALPHHARPAALFWPLRVQIDPDMSSPLRKMQAVEPWASSGVAGATDAASVPHLLARWASVDGEETLLEMSHDCALERGMAE